MEHQQDDAPRLAVVSEELAVADDELLAQQQQIDELLRREQEARTTLHDLITAVPVAVVTTDADGLALDANQPAAALLGLAATRLVGKPLPVYVVPADRPRVRSLLREAVEGGGAGAAVSLVPRSGPERRVHLSLHRTGHAEPRVTWVVIPDSAKSVTAGVAADSGEGTAEGAGGTPDDAALQAVAAITRLPVGEATTHELLAALAALAVLAVRGITGARWASVTLGDPGSPADTASDSEVAQRADGAQWRVQDGPCAEAWREGTAVHSDDLRTERRWPALVPTLRDLPVRSVLAVPVLVEETAAGVLNLYGEQPGALTPPRALEHAQVFAAAAGALLQGARRVEQLRTTAEQLGIAMRSRATIEQAKGLIAGRLGCDVEEAFAVLTKVSQDRNVKLRDLATLIVADTTRQDLTPLLRAVHDRRARP